MFGSPGDAHGMFSSLGDTKSSNVLSVRLQLPPRIPRYSSAGWSVPRVNYKSVAAQTSGVSGRE